MSRRAIAVASAVTCAGLVVTGCGKSDSSGGGSDGPYRVLVTGGLSAQGVLAANSKTSVISAQAAADVVNKSGGIDGRKVEVTVVDDGGDPTTAVTKLRQAIAKKKPDLYLNSGPSTVASATLPILTQNKILSFNIGPTGNSADPGKNPLNFDLSPSPADYAKGFVAHAKEKGYKTVGILHGSSSYGETFGKSVKKAFSDAGFTISGMEGYDDAALDMTPQMEALKGKKPDVLVLQGYGPPVGYLLKSLKKLGWDVPVITDTSVSATSLISTPAPKGLLGTDQVENLALEVFTSTVHDKDDARVNEAVKAMKAKGKIPSTLINAYNYDAIPLVAAAAEKTGKSGDPEALAKALTQPDVLKQAKVAIMKDYRFTADAHSPHAGADAFEFIKPAEVRDGQFQP